MRSRRPRNGAVDKRTGGRRREATRERATYMARTWEESSQTTRRRMGTTLLSRCPMPARAGRRSPQVPPRCSDTRVATRSPAVGAECDSCADAGPVARTLPRWNAVADRLRWNKGGLGDLGGGNHFLDALSGYRDEQLYFLIHTGSAQSRRRATRSRVRPRGRLVPPEGLADSSLRLTFRHGDATRQNTRTTPPSSYHMSPPPA